MKNQKADEENIDVLKYAWVERDLNGEFENENARKSDGIMFFVFNNIRNYGEKKKI